MNAWCVLYRTTTDTYHPTLFELAENVGTCFYEIPVARLVSKLHHSSGFENLDEANSFIIREAIKSVPVPIENIGTEPIDWNGEEGICLLLPNWKAMGNIDDAIRSARNENGNVHQKSESGSQ